MRNKYEFNIEDINSVIIHTITDPSNYTIISSRKIKPSKTFVERYSADRDVILEDGVIGVICPRCGAWSYYNQNEFDPEYFDTMDYCHKCNDTYEVSYSEDDLIELIMSFMDEESFAGVKIYINGTLIE